VGIERLDGSYDGETPAEREGTAGVPVTGSFSRGSVTKEPPEGLRQMVIRFKIKKNWQLIIALVVAVWTHTVGAFRSA
jgi:hypothetical protein